MIPPVNIWGQFDRSPEILRFLGNRDPSRTLLDRVTAPSATRLLHRRGVFDVGERLFTPFRHTPHDLVPDALTREHRSRVAK